MTGATAADRPDIKLVISDIDGTLVTRAKVLTIRARAAIQAMQAGGIAFTVASARPPAGLRDMVGKLGIDTLVGAVNGGAIIRPDLTIVEQLAVPVQAVRTTVAMLRQQGIDAWLFTADKWFLRDPNGAHVDHEAKTIGLEPIVVTEFDEADLGRTLKIVAASHNHALLGECEDIIQAALGGAALATRSQAYYLDITNAGANKGGAVVRIARHLGIPLENVLTIGDGANDAPMFGVSGFSVAMGNASDAVKHAARAVTDSCEEEGFAKAIERYVLGTAEPGDHHAPTSKPTLEGARP